MTRSSSNHPPIKVKCHRCDKEINLRSSICGVCVTCNASLESQKKREFEQECRRLSVEERLSKIESWIYNNKKL